MVNDCLSQPLYVFHRYVPAPGQTQKECLRQCPLVWHQQRQQHLWHLDLQRPGSGLHCKYLKGKHIFHKYPDIIPTFMYVSL